ncbi:hypothetical protein [Alicyclobacillus shizuokensis]|uniref:hypothetical protein n=1 Tax=Alicyclobacillus shizuokensis TaxID=392014 RepID=UPI000A61680B|nr:hypothetical protein [Alicyclobacillus shizuokensis]
MKHDRIYLNAFVMNCVSHQSPGLWTHPSDQGYRYTDIDFWAELAQTLERGRFDAVFLADVLGVYDVYQGSRDAAVRHAAQVPLNDPDADCAGHGAGHNPFRFWCHGISQL